MPDSTKTRAQLIEESNVLRTRVRELEDAASERLKVEETLRASKEELQAVYDGAVDGMVILASETRRFVRANPAMCDMLGYSERELLSMSLADVIPPYRRPQAMIGFAETAEGKESSWTNIPFLRKNGEVFFVDISARPIAYKGLPCTIGFFRDITGRKQADEALRASERKLRAIFDHTFQFIGLMTPDGVLTEANRAALDFAGIEESDVLGKPFWETPWWTHSSELQDRLRGAVSRAAAGDFVRFEATHPAADGTIHSVDFSLKPVMDESGNVVLLIPEGRDITVRKRVEEDLRKFKTISDRASYGAAISDLEGNVTYVNRAFAGMHGYAPAELVGKHLSVFHTEEQMERVNALNERLKGEDGFSAEEVWHKRRDGSVFPMLMNATIITDDRQTPLFLSATAIDITERKRAEEDLKEGRNKYRALFEDSPVLLRETDMTAVLEHLRGLREDGVGDLHSYFDDHPEEILQCAHKARIVDINRASVEFYGAQSKKELIERIDETFLSGQFDPVKEQLVALSEGVIPSPFDATVRTLSGEQRHLSVHLSVPGQTQGRLSTVVYASVDITGRRRIEEALRESEERFRTVVETGKDAVLAINREGRLIVFNPAAEKMFGRKQEAMISQSLDVLLPEKYREQHRQDVYDFFATGEPHGVIGKTVEMPALHSDGSVFPMELSLSVGQRGGERFVLAIIRDITERKQAEAQARKHQAELAHISRLSTMGEMAAELAHELNQPLAAIINYTKGSLRRIRSGSVTLDALVRPMEQTADQAVRAGRIIRRVRDFVSRKEPEHTAVNIGELVEGAIELVEHAVRTHDVTVLLDLPDSLPMVTADRVGIQQVVINLVLNAVDALSESAASDRQVCARAAATDGGGIEIAIDDHGPGVPADLTERIFEPFFTTRAEGMGMGLAICRSIIADHNGRLWMTPNPGRGVTFHFALPGSP